MQHQNPSVLIIQSTITHASSWDEVNPNTQHPTPTLPAYTSDSASCYPPPLVKLVHTFSPCMHNVLMVCWCSIMTHIASTTTTVEIVSNTMILKLVPRRTSTRQKRLDVNDREPFTASVISSCSGRSEPKRSGHWFVWTRATRQKLFTIGLKMCHVDTTQAKRKANACH